MAALTLEFKHFDLHSVAIVTVPMANVLHFLGPVLSLHLDINNLSLKRALLFNTLEQGSIYQPWKYQPFPQQLPTDHSKHYPRDGD